MQDENEGMDSEDFRKRLQETENFLMNDGKYIIEE